MIDEIERDGLVIRIYRFGFSPGFYAEAVSKDDGRRLAFTGVYRGKGSKERCIKSAISQARTGEAAQDDIGCPG